MPPEQFPALLEAFADWREGYRGRPSSSREVAGASVCSARSPSGPCSTAAGCLDK